MPSVSSDHATHSLHFVEHNLESTDPISSSSPPDSSDPPTSDASALFDHFERSSRSDSPTSPHKSPDAISETQISFPDPEVLRSRLAKIPEARMSSPKDGSSSFGSLSTDSEAEPDHLHGLPSFSFSRFSSLPLPSSTPASQSVFSIRSASQNLPPNTSQEPNGLVFSNLVHISNRIASLSPTRPSSKRIHSEMEDCAPTASLSPIKKRARMTPDASTRTYPVYGYAAEPASMRRAVSLNSAAAKSTDRNRTILRLKDLNCTEEVPKDWVPTAPSTPMPDIKPSRPTFSSYSLIPPESISSPSPKRKSLDVSVAAPYEYSWSAPLSSSTSAALRIKRLLARERAIPPSAGPKVIGKDVAAGLSSEERNLNLKGTWERHLGVGLGLRLDVVRWLLTVLPDSDAYTHLGSQPVRPSKSAFRRASSSDTPSCDTDMNSPSSESCSTSCSSLSTATLEYVADDDIPDLLDQLKTSPTTRFHAAQMFLRFFDILAMGDGKISEDKKKANVEGVDGAKSAKKKADRELVIWDIALASLALSVKLHRDFLPPLHPIYAAEYEVLAPHTMSYDDLEAAQRDVLASFGYTLGDSPELVLEELWAALPALKELLGEGATGGWNEAKHETWKVLVDAIMEPDVLRFPITLLTASALMYGVTTCVERRIKRNEPYYIGLVPSKMQNCSTEYPSIVGSELESEMRIFRKAKRECEGVFLDVAALLELTSKQLKECLDWMSDLVPEMGSDRRLDAN